MQVGEQFARITVPLYEAPEEFVFQSGQCMSCSLGNRRSLSRFQMGCDSLNGQRMKVAAKLNHVCRVRPWLRVPRRRSQVLLGYADFVYAELKGTQCKRLVLRRHAALEQRQFFFLDHSLEFLLCVFTGA